MNSVTYNLFENIVYSLIGGLEMGDEFFERHPIREAMCWWAREHYDNGRTMRFAATMFYERMVKHRIKADFERETKRRWPWPQPWLKPLPSPPQNWDYLDPRD